MEKNICNHKGCINEGRYCRIPHSFKPAKEESPAPTKPVKKTIPVKKKKTTNTEKLKMKQRTAFFEAMIKIAPKKCMETGKPLAGSMVINPRSIVAHILPKRDADKGGVPSMQYDKRNIIFLDQDVHTDMDRQGKDYVVKMKLYPLMKERVAEMWPEINAAERKNVPEYLKP